jgi:hypothetical protein
VPWLGRRSRQFVRRHHPRLRPANLTQVGLAPQSRHRPGARNVIRTRIGDRVRRADQEVRAAREVKAEVPEDGLATSVPGRA